MKDNRTQFSPRDPETMAETGPQNHPLPGTVDFVEGFAFAPRIAAEARAAIAAAGPGPVTCVDEIGPLLIVKRLRRKVDVMRLDAARNSSLWYDLEEVLALVDLIAVQMGGEA